MTTATVIIIILWAILAVFDGFNANICFDMYRLTGRTKERTLGIIYLIMAFLWIGLIVLRILVQ